MESTAELFEISPNGRMPGLALPFALVGSTAAFFSVLAIGAGSDAMLEAPPALATAFAMFVGAALGVLLGRWKRLHDPFLGRDARALRIAFLVDELDKATDHEADSAGTIDLGLGADRWARPAALATYRATARGEVVLKGSLHDARRAIDEALRHRRCALAFSVLMLAASALSSVIGAFLVWLAGIY